MGTVTLIEVKYWNLYGEWHLNIFSVPREFNVEARKVLLDRELGLLAGLLRDTGTEIDHFSHKIEFNLSEYRTLDAED